MKNIRHMRNIFRMIIFSVAFLFLISFCYFFIGSAQTPEKITWGVNFSQKQAESLGLDWKQSYLAMFDDLGAKNMKLAVHWDFIEPERGVYDFEDLDWQIKEAENHNANILLAIGMKTPRWPECHIPNWAKGEDKENQQERIMQLIKEIVLRYQNSSAVKSWQVENEPFFVFGECPWHDQDFLKKEIALVKFLDQKQRQVVISDSGEQSSWFKAAKVGDVVGTTIYRTAWVKFIGFYYTSPLPPVFYWRKSQIIKTIFNKEVFCSELQVEPWGKVLLSESPISEQEKTMNLKKFKNNIQYAKKTGFNEIYMWGAEWWYWMKEKQGNPEIWEEAKKLF